MERALIIEYTITEIKSSAGFTKKTPASHPLEITHVCAMKPSRAHNHFVGAVTVRVAVLGLCPHLAARPTDGDLVTRLPEYGSRALQTGKRGPHILGVVNHNRRLFGVTRVPTHLRVLRHHDGRRIVASSRQRVYVGSEATNEASTGWAQTAALRDYTNSCGALEV